MSRDDEADRGRDEPIDVEFEPARRERARGGVSGGTALLLSVLAAGVGAAGGAAAPRIPAVRAALDNALPPIEQTEAGQVQTAAAGDDVAALRQQIEALDAIVNAPLPIATSASATDAGTSARVFAIQAGLRQIEERLQALPSQTEVTSLVAEVRQLQEELPAVAAEARTAANAARASYAVVAAAEASRSSGSFEQAYTALAALLPEDENVLALAPLARTGAPTRGELYDRFDRIDNDIVRAAAQARAGAGFWGRIQAALAQWIVIRRSGEGNTPAGVVERAHARLDADDLEGAIEQLNTLTGAPRGVVDPWLNDARRRLEIDQRMAAVRLELSRGS